MPNTTRSPKSPAVRAVLGTVTLLGAALVSAQTTPSREPLPIEAVLNARAFGEYNPMQVSPDNRWVAYATRQASGGTRSMSFTREHTDRTGVPWYAAGASLWVVNTADGQSRQVPSGGNAWAPKWSPDGRYLAFLSDEPGASKASHSRVWIWESASGKTREVSAVNVRSRELNWSNDSRRLLVTVLPEGMTLEAYAKRAGGVKQDTPRPEGSTVRIYQSARRSDPNALLAGGWNLERGSADLAWIDIGSGAVDRLVRDAPIYKVTLSPDGRYPTYTVAKKFEKAGSQQILFDLAVVDGRTPRIVAPDIRLTYDGSNYSWSPDSQRLAFRTTGMLANGDVSVVALDGQAPKLVTPEPHAKFGRVPIVPLWDAGGTTVYFTDGEALWRAPIAQPGASEVAKLPSQAVSTLAQRGNVLWSADSGGSTIVLTRDTKNGASGFQRIDLKTGAVSAVQVEEKFYGGYGGDDGLAVADNGQMLVYAAQDAQHGADLYLLRPAQTGARRLTTINPDLERYTMGERRIIEWRSIDGQAVRGVLLLPAGYESGKRYPLIAKVYGGAKPSEQLANRFGLQSPAVDNLQLYATRGYAVLLPDLPLTSTGRVAIDLVKLIVPGVDKVVEMGIADPDGLGVTGHSFGGYNTIALITQTTRFKAALMSAGLANIFSAYGEMSEDGTAYGAAVIEQGQFLVQGTPWEKTEAYLENSPIFHLDRVETPLMITHGAKDSAVAPFLADEIFVGLRRLGKEVLYAKYDNEEHHQAQWTYANQLDHWTRALAWFDQHLKKPSGTAKTPSAALPR